jgi:uncharacterized protein (DUF1697 family)
MTTYVALLRGVNVGGHHKLPMADLRSLMTDAGYRDANTYIQSGNVVFTSTSKPAAISRDLEQRIEAMAGFAVPVMLRKSAELRNTLDRNPFLAKTDDPTKLHVVFFAKPVPAAALKAVDPAAYAPEEFAPRGGDLYLYLPDGMGRAKLAKAKLDTSLGMLGTARNWKTVTKLVELADA